MICSFLVVSSSYNNGSLNFLIRNGLCLYKSIYTQLDSLSYQYNRGTVLPHEGNGDLTIFLLSGFLLRLCVALLFYLVRIMDLSLSLSLLGMVHANTSTDLDSVSYQYNQ